MLSINQTKTTRTCDHEGIPHIRTEITILSPITDESKFRDDVDNKQRLVKRIVAEINTNFEESIADNFGATVERIKSTIQNL